jgi:hypothetical protein
VSRSDGGSPARVRAVLAVAGCAALLGVGVPVPVHASCAGPGLAVPGATVRLGVEAAGEAQSVTVLPAARGRLVVEGVSFSNGACDDTPDTSGCSGRRATTPTLPAADVPLVLVQGERSWTLGASDAAGDEQGYRVRWEVVLPPGLEPGAALLRASTAELQLEVPAP